MDKYVSKSNLVKVWAKIKALLNTKADTTTVNNAVNQLKAVATQATNGMMPAADKKKLDGIAEGANKYTYPYTHYSKDSVGDIGWDASKNQLITGSAIAFWNGRYDKTGSNLQYCRRGEIAALSDIKTYTLPTASATVLGGVKVGAGLAMTNGVLSATGGGVADAVEWKNVQNKPTFSTVATSGSYNDLANKPAIPSVGNGTITITQAGQNKGSFTLNQSGNATIALNDTNTTYSAATQTTNGLMSAADKKKLDGIATGANNYALPVANTNTLGGVKSSVTGTTAGRDYKVQVNSDGTMKVNVPWTDTNTTYGLATESTNGLMSAADKEKLKYFVPDDVPQLSDISWKKTATEVSFYAESLREGNVSLPIGAASTTQAGIMTASDKTKLDGIDMSTKADLEDGVVKASQLKIPLSRGTIFLNGTVNNVKVEIVGVYQVMSVVYDTANHKILGALNGKYYSSWVKKNAETSIIGGQLTVDRSEFCADAGVPYPNRKYKLGTLDTAIYYYNGTELVKWNESNNYLTLGTEAYQAFPGNEGKKLKETISNISETATANKDGIMSAADKKKLDGIDTSTFFLKSSLTDIVPNHWDYNGPINASVPSRNITYQSGCCYLFMGAEGMSGNLIDLYLLVSFVDVYCVAVPIKQSGLIEFIKDNTKKNIITLQAKNSATIDADTKGGYSFFMRKICFIK